MLTSWILRKKHPASCLLPQKELFYLHDHQPCQAEPRGPQCLSLDGVGGAHSCPGFMCLPGVDSTPNELGAAGNHRFKLIPIHCCAPVPWTLVQNGTGDKDQPYLKPGPREAGHALAILLPEDPGAREKCELRGPCALKEGELPGLERRPWLCLP